MIPIGGTTTSPTQTYSFNPQSTNAVDGLRNEGAQFFNVRAVYSPLANGLLMLSPLATN